MPIYEYRCRACGHELEKIQKISDPLLVDCPECDEPALTKLVSAAAFRLKGGGWYETDFKNDNKRNIAGEARSDEGKPKEGKKDKDAGTEAKSDAGSGGRSSSSGGDKAGGASSGSAGQAA